MWQAWIEHVAVSNRALVVSFGNDAKALAALRLAFETRPFLPDFVAPLN